MANANSTQIEQWLPVVGFPDYEVSDFGQVKRVKRARAVSAGQILKRKHAAKLRYPSVGLWRLGKPSYQYVHRLVLTAFIGPCPAPDMQCCHRDGNVNNNHISNLRWGTRVENEADKNKHGTVASGSRHGASKLNDLAVREMRTIHKHLKWTYRKLADVYGITPACAWNAVNRNTWRHVA